MHDLKIAQKNLARKQNKKDVIHKFTSKLAKKHGLVVLEDLERALSRNNQYEKNRNTLLQGIPAKRFASPEEIAHAILLFAADNTSYITGADLAIDGGAVARTLS